ncbi:hypothetical protein NPIL_461541 [Nephila pilipes]|uniref:Uncharacterized protein n=1 Tax=Nephila pilipes TaxID=299642 RepID=A0A8X6PE34_NEPPI|nr:hypothetical protein NPIL_461541 [Nephila pilipes]
MERISYPHQTQKEGKALLHAKTEKAGGATNREEGERRCKQKRDFNFRKPSENLERKSDESAGKRSADRALELTKSAEDAIGKNNTQGITHFI